MYLFRTVQADMEFLLKICKNNLKRVIFSPFFTELPIFGGYFVEWVDNKREIHYNLNIECYQIMAKMLQRNYDSVFRHFCLW